MIIILQWASVVKQYSPNTSRLARLHYPKPFPCTDPFCLICACEECALHRDWGCPHGA
jgi:hypothetical protein